MSSRSLSYYHLCYVLRTRTSAHEYSCFSSRSIVFFLHLDQLSARKLKQGLFLECGSVVYHNVCFNVSLTRRRVHRARRLTANCPKPGDTPRLQKSMRTHSTQNTCKSLIKIISTIYVHCIYSREFSPSYFPLFDW